MPDYNIVKKDIYTRYGRYLKSYPFSYVKWVDITTGAEIGGGLQPDGVMVFNDPNKLADTEFPFEETTSEIDPRPFFSDVCATGFKDKQFI